MRGSAQLGAGVFSGGLIFGIGDFGTITGGFYTVVAETLFWTLHLNRLHRAARWLVVCNAWASTAVLCPDS